MGDARMPVDGSGLGHALRTVGDRLPTAERVLLCTDFDGTLAPIADRPAEVTPVTESRRHLRRLRDHDRSSVVVVSGRELADLRSRLGVDGITYAGNHGIEVHAEGETTVHPEAKGYRDVTKRVCDAFDGAYQLDNDLFVEDKGWSVTVHYREAAAERVPRLRDEIETVVDTVGDGRLKTVDGKQAVEVRPAIDWDKGACVSALVENSAAEVLPVFVGDDENDRPGFRAVERHGGVSVGVGRDDAQTRLDEPGDVAVFLRWLANTGLGRCATETDGRRRSA